MPESTQNERSQGMPNDLDSLWMPFTANRQFKSAPRMLVSAEGMHYTTSDGRQVLDATSGLWCVNCGHARKEITEAVSAQVGRLDYAPGFQMGHPASFSFAARLAALAPGDLDHVFFTNSGSESADTALKIALAYHNVTGNASRTRLIGREKGLPRRRLRRLRRRRHRQQPQIFRFRLSRRRPSAAYPQPRAQRLYQGPARMGRSSRR
jgi:beta-alanine--pyruvate transaminase